MKRIGVDAVTLLDEFAENLLEELDYTLEATNIQGGTVVDVLLMCCYCGAIVLLTLEATNILAFQSNFFGDTTVKIPDVYPELSSEKVLVMECVHICIHTYIRVSIHAYIHKHTYITRCW